MSDANQAEKWRTAEELINVLATELHAAKAEIRRLRALDRDDRDHIIRLLANNKERRRAEVQENE